MGSLSGQVLESACTTKAADSSLGHCKKDLTSCKEGCSVYKFLWSCIRRIIWVVELFGLACPDSIAKYLCKAVCCLLELRLPGSGFITSHGHHEGFGKSVNVVPYNAEF